MLRELTKSGIANALHMTGMDTVIGARKGVRHLPLIVGYHRVVQDFDRSTRNSIAPMLVSADTFEKQIDWLASNYKIVSLDEIAGAIDESCCTKKRLAAITFDDGYADVYHNAFPILKRKGLPSTVFVVTDLLGTRRIQPHDEYFLFFSELGRADRKTQLQLLDCMKRKEIDAEIISKVDANLADAFSATRACIENLSHKQILETDACLRQLVEPDSRELEELYSMNWEMLEEMKDNGVTIGSHTQSHSLLSGASKEQLRSELVSSKKILERRLNIRVKHFAYPDGSFDNEAIKAVFQAGYQAAYTICTHRNTDFPQMTIPRRMLWEKSSMGPRGRVSKAVLNCQSNGIFDPASLCQRSH